jgi:hypothetical protein
MHGPIKVKSPNNTRKWQMGFNSAFKGLILVFSLNTLAMRADEKRRLFFSSIIFSEIHEV